MSVFTVYEYRIIRLAHCKCKSLLFCSSHLTVVCLSVCLSVLSQILKTRQDKREILSPDRKSGSPSKNMTSNFAQEVAQYPNSSPKTPK